MGNPLSIGGGNGSGAAMRPGETKILTARDSKTGEVIKTYTLERTTASYAEDLRDAYNRDLRDSPIRWVVTPGGELKLTHDLNWSRNNLAETKRTMEADRRQFNERRASHDRDQRRDAA